MTSDYDILPAIVPAGQFLIRTAHLIVALSHLAVYPDAVRLDLQLSGTAGGPGPVMHSSDDFEHLAYAVSFGADYFTVVDDWRHLARTTGPLQLSHFTSETSASAARADSRVSLLLRPLPPPVPGELTIIAPDFGSALSPCPLDGPVIAAAAQRAQPYSPARP